MVVLDVVDNDKHYHFELTRRISFVRGDSGIGKTGLCDIITRSASSAWIKVTVTELEEVRVITEYTFRHIPEYYNTLLLFDDFLAANSSDTASMYKKYALKNNLYFVFISRVNYDGIDVGGGLSYSINSVYNLVSEAGVYTLAPRYVFPEWSSTNFDIALTEDTGGNYRYLKSILKIPVQPTSVGKATITRDLVKLMTEGYKSVLVFMDSAAFGCHMEEFYWLFSDVLYKDCNIAIMTLYECFEELLCQSNMVRPLTNELDAVEDYANNHLSWEVYFEALLEKLTRDKFCKYKHGRGNVSDCYSVSCDICNPHKKIKCDCVLPGSNKLEALFRGTKYEFLLNIMKGVV